MLSIQAVLSSHQDEWCDRWAGRVSVDQWERSIAADLTNQSWLWCAPNNFTTSELRAVEWLMSNFTIYIFWGLEQEYLCLMWINFIRLSISNQKTNSCLSKSSEMDLLSSNSLFPPQIYQVYYTLQAMIWRQMHILLLQISLFSLETDHWCDVMMLIPDALMSLMERSKWLWSTNSYYQHNILNLIATTLTLLH